MKYYDCVWMVRQQASLPLVWNCPPWRVHWSAFDNRQTRIAANGSAMGCGPNPLVWGGDMFPRPIGCHTLHMEIHTWRCFSCWCHVTRKILWDLRNMLYFWPTVGSLNNQIDQVSFPLFSACKRLRLLVTNSKGSYKYFCSSATILVRLHVAELLSSMDGLQKSLANSVREKKWRQQWSSSKLWFIVGRF